MVDQIIDEEQRLADQEPQKADPEPLRSLVCIHAGLFPPARVDECHVILMRLHGRFVQNSSRLSQE